jgi:hypothetical protein
MAPARRMYRTPDGCTIRRIVKIGSDPQPLLMRLLDAELLSRSSVVSGKLVVVCDPAQTVFRFIDKGSAHLIVRVGRFARERTILDRFDSDDRLAAVRALLPEVALRDDELLVLRAFNDGSDVVEYHRLLVRPAEWIPPLIGAWLAAMHRGAAAIVNDISLPREAPPLLRMEAGTSPIADALRRVADGWQSNTVIHGNLLFENIFVAADGERAIQLVGWDEAMIGDEAWDLAAVIESYYAWSLDPNMVATVDGPVCSVTAADLRLLVTSFLNAYTAVAGLSPAAAQTLFLRAIGYAGARLIAHAGRLQAKPESVPALPSMMRAAVAMITSPDVVVRLFSTPPPAAQPQMWSGM